MIKKIVLLSAFLLFKTLLCQKSDSVYYDEDWKITGKANASYYRSMPVKEVGELILLQDFYIDGTPQFEGYTLKSNEDAYVGDIVWYDKNGNDSNFSQYRNETENLILTYYHRNGKIRKRVHYKDGVKNGETAIFDENGEILMKAFYVNGKPESGDFETLKDEYENSISDHTEAAVVVVESTVVYQEPSKTREKKTRKTITQKTFWRNSRNPAQEKVYAISEYSLDLIQQKNFDPSGKLIQTIVEKDFGEYNGNILNGTEYLYYLQNNFATGVSSSARFVNGEKSGKQISYFPKGGISYETHYLDGVKEGEEIVFSADGDVKSKRTYINNEPFNGNFEENEGNVSVNINYLNGLKEGEAVAKNEEQQVVAKGIYRKGEPYSGTFVVSTGDDSRELITVENFKKTGLQKVFSHRLESPDKTYTVQNGKLNGPTTFYEEGQPVAVLEYKDDEPYSGMLVDSEKTSLYRDGKIVEETYYQDAYSKKEDNIQKIKGYEKGIFSKVKDYSFVIAEKPQNYYEGFLKNGKPHSGYFETDVSREFKQVDYYENGMPKFQYSNDYLKNMDHFRQQSYDIRSVYKDGKIYEGVEYVLNEEQFVSKYWKGGVLQSFDWDLFGMNYFNRIHFEIKNGDIVISDLQKKQSAVIKVDVSPKSLKSNFLWMEKLLIVKGVIFLNQNTMKESFFIL